MKKFEFNYALLVFIVNVLKVKKDITITNPFQKVSSQSKIASQTKYG